MIFNTHDRTPKIEPGKILKITKIYCFVFLAAFFLFLAIATSITSQSILPAVIILIPFAFISILVMIQMNDMNKAYVQIDEDHITVVDYYFFRKKERCFSFHEIKTAEIVPGYSFRVRGYRYSAMGFSYIVFKNSDGKYLFKIVNLPETNDYFGKYFQIR